MKVKMYLALLNFKVKTIKFTGELPLDERFVELFGEDYKIYQENNLIYDCMLNQVFIHLVLEISFFF